MKSGIYCITNIVNGKIYVGSAEDFKARARRHKSELKLNRHHSVKLQRSYNKYGLESFKWEIFEYCEVEDLIIREQFWLNVLECVDLGCNICRIAGSRQGTTHTPKTRANMSESRKGVLNSFYGKPHTDEFKQRMSQAREKPFKLVSPAGEIIEGVNLKKFCKENNLCKGNMSHVIHGKVKPHKGYTKFIEPETGA